MHSKRAENRKIAKERVDILKKMIKKHPEFSERYKALIVKITKKYRLE